MYEMIFFYNNRLFSFGKSFSSPEVKTLYISQLDVGDDLESPIHHLTSEFTCVRETLKKNTLCDRTSTNLIGVNLYHSDTSFSKYLQCGLKSELFNCFPNSS